MGVEEHLKQPAELIDRIERILGIRELLDFPGIIGFAFKVQHCYELVVRTVKIMDQPGTRLDVAAKRFDRPLA
ncbi:hypothetical protein [Sphaerochaeta sp.]|uniref:hypothetical protein n=1 Tax=Sphaerochaeta sp. TaxID=1972642 RepID=UPI003D14E4E8